MQYATPTLWSNSYVLKVNMQFATVLLTIRSSLTVLESYLMLTVGKRRVCLNGTGGGGGGGFIRAWYVTDLPSSHWLSLGPS